MLSWKQFTLVPKEPLDNISPNIHWSNFCSIASFHGLIVSLTALVYNIADFWLLTIYLKYGYLIWNEILFLQSYLSTFMHAGECLDLTFHNLTFCTMDYHVQFSTTMYYYELSCTVCLYTVKHYHEQFCVSCILYCVLMFVEGVAVADYEEGRQIEFRAAVADLLPALLIMLGSFTEFVRYVYAW